MKEKEAERFYLQSAVISQRIPFPAETVRLSGGGLFNGIHTTSCIQYCIWEMSPAQLYIEEF